MAKNSLVPMPTGKSVLPKLRGSASSCVGRWQPGS